ncbi:heptaprenylglyceryl phosphate synthase [Calderihabitans maritimus]|uniref:Geranylgeranylglyceryl phosphate synthase n=1 Tax=Calderihabitans maritimus TaxID=1246530 RepID=A0A1Z5HV06_9FIRM|nr:heptaprenylglyceryl phosphate synthase [Calderihabitans maritimus]GAW93369.1 geranylgeranylglyceryl phosphate synthase [Calderihabitans maritimus]
MDYSIQWNKWKHVTKLDPDKNNSRELIKEVRDSGTDAVIIGGTQRITREKVTKLLEQVRNICGHHLPVVIEVSSPEAVVSGADAYLIPVVLNSGKVTWLVEAHRKVMQQIGELLYSMKGPEILIPEAYVVLNPLSAVAQVTESRTELEPEEVLAYARVGERVFNFPIVYLEYSGIYGDPRLVRMVKEGLRYAQVFYGGGIDSAAKAKEMARAADTVVIGNVVYANRDYPLNDLVSAVKGIKNKAPEGANV